jgi:hypothetical protein
VLPTGPLECRQDALMRAVASGNGFDSLLQKLDSNSNAWLHYCVVENRNQSGNDRTVMLLGNSFASRGTVGVLDALQGRFSKLYFFSRPSCTPFDSLDEDQDAWWDCPKAHGLAFLLAEAIRPEWIFLEQSMHGLSPCIAPIDPDAGRPIREDKCWQGLDDG